MTTEPNKKAFWKALRILGCRALAGVPRGLRGHIDTTAEGTDDFWSAGLFDTLAFEWQHTDKPTVAVEQVLREYAGNVRDALSGWSDEYAVDRIQETSSVKSIAFLIKAATLQLKPR